MWDEQVRALEARYHVLRVDLRGHGASPAPEGPYALADLARDVVDVADAAGVGRFHLVGISLGGLVGLWLAVHAAERLRTLTVANTAARIGTEASWQDRIRAVHAQGMRRLGESIISRWFAPAFAAASPELLARVQGVFASTSAVGYAGCCAALAVADLRAEVAAIRVPVLIIGGALDAVTPIAQASWLHEAIAGSTLCIIEGAAHLSNLDQRDAFTESLGAFLDRESAK
jgi:3-oxoadipate enol-lactonase